MVQHDRSVVFARFGGFFLFFLMTMGCLVWFVWSLYSTINLMSSNAQVIYFDKGSLYMLGAGIGLASLTFAILYEGLLMRDLTKKVTRAITGGALVGVALMFILPNMLHYLSNTYLSEKRYIVCSEVSYQWFLYKKVVYTDNRFTCEALAREKEVPGGSGGR